MQNEINHDDVSLPQHGLSEEEKLVADNALKLMRFKRLNEIGEASRIYAELLRIKYEIIDYLDKTIRLGDIQNGTNTIDLSNLPSGLYFIKVSDENETFTRKIIKE